MNYARYRYKSPSQVSLQVPLPNARYVNSTGQHSYSKVKMLPIHYGKMIAYLSIF